MSERKEDHCPFCGIFLRKKIFFTCIACHKEEEVCRSCSLTADERYCFKCSNNQPVPESYTIEVANFKAKQAKRYENKKEWFEASLKEHDITCLWAYKVDKYKIDQPNCFVNVDVEISDHCIKLEPLWDKCLNNTAELIFLTNCYSLYTEITRFFEDFQDRYESKKSDKYMQWISDCDYPDDFGLMNGTLGICIFYDMAELKKRIPTCFPHAFKYNAYELEHYNKKQQHIASAVPITCLQKTYTEHKIQVSNCSIQDATKKLKQACKTFDFTDEAWFRHCQWSLMFDAQFQSVRMYLYVKKKM